MKATPSPVLHGFRETGEGAGDEDFVSDQFANSIFKRAKIHPFPMCLSRRDHLCI